MTLNIDSSQHEPQQQLQQQHYYCTSRRHRQRRIDMSSIDSNEHTTSNGTSSSLSSTTEDNTSTSSCTTPATTTKEDANIMDHPEIAPYGFRNYMEVLCYVSALLFMISATTVGVVVAVHQHQDTYHQRPETVGSVSPTFTPVLMPQPQAATIVNNNQEKLDIILQTLSSSAILSDKALAIPSSLSELNIVSSYLNQNRNRSLSTMTIDDPYLLAAAYMVQNDTTNIKEHIIPRYSLAILYYTTQGDDWYNRTNWLSPEYYCHWHGIICCDSDTVGSAVCTTPSDYGRILEIDLHQNHLVGTIPHALTLLPYLQSIYFSENKLSGIIPGAALGSLSHLLKFYASYNELSGTIPIEFKNNAIFSTLYVQGNNLSGIFPFCKSSRLHNFGIDCAKVKCDTVCCESIKHCFHIGISQHYHHKQQQSILYNILET